MPKLLKIIPVAVLFFGLFGRSAAQQNQNTQNWQQLFNGKDLTGWDIKITGQDLNDNYLNTFRVEDGILRVVYDQYQKFDDKFGHLYFKQPFSYYIVRFEYRFVGNQAVGGAPWNVRNSGIMLHSQSAQSLSKNQTFPVSLEMQFLGGLGKGTRPTGNLCTPGTQVYMNQKLVTEHCTSSKSKTYDGDQWVRAEAIVLGDSVVHQIVEGDTVLSYQKLQIGGGFVNGVLNWKNGGIDNADEWIKKDGTPLKEGYIALQAESHPIEFRKVELLNLKGCTDPKALNYKSYYQKSDNSQCVYANAAIGIVKHNHIALQVKDMPASVQFYGQLLGLERVPVPENLKDIRAWFKIGPDQQIHLLAGRTQAVVNDRNGSHFAVFVASMDKAEAYLKALNFPFHKQVRFDGVVQIYLADPDGYLVELNEFKMP